MTGQPELFVVVFPAPPAAPIRIAEMHKLFGKREGERCGTCAHCIVHQPGQNRYRKCDLTAYTSGPSTDWRVRWTACGKWERRNVV